MPNYLGFSSWDELLAHIDADRNLFYHAPLDRFPSLVAVRRRFKNGKLRVWSGSLAFTADSGHLDRFKRIA